MNASEYSTDAHHEIGTYSPAGIRYIVIVFNMQIYW